MSAPYRRTFETYAGMTHPNPSAGGRTGSYDAKKQRDPKGTGKEGARGWVKKTGGAWFTKEDRRRRRKRAFAMTGQGGRDRFLNERVPCETPVRV